MNETDQIREYIQNLLASASDWQTGYLSGMLVTLLLFILVFLIVHFLFWGGRYAKGITQIAPHGDIFISARSISDLVKSLDSDLPGIVIGKVRLRKDRRRKFILEISLDYQVSGSSDNAREMLETLQAKALSTLQTTFGVDLISKVRIDIRRTKHIKPSF